MIFEQLATAGDRTFAYLIACATTSQAALVDPAYSPEMLLVRAQELNLQIRYVINTHSHSDHTNGNQAIIKATGAQLVAHASSPLNPDIPVNDGDQLALGDLSLTFIHTPGHTPDGICIHVGNNLCTGDTLFVGKIGGTYTRAGARSEYESLTRKILTLPDDTIIWPGHDYGTQPSSTVAHEREANPFLQQPSFEAFLDLKANWAEYKRKHGIK